MPLYALPVRLLWIDLVCRVVGVARYLIQEWMRARREYREQ